MNTRKLTWLLAGFCAMAAVVPTACKKKTETPPAATTTGGTTTNNNNNNNTTTPDLTQEQIDDNTANNIINATIDIYNQNVAGRSQGAYNGVTVNCPNGGTALIQGSATKATNSDLTTTDLTYTMSACVETKTNHSFTYTGVVTAKGSFDISASFVAETIQSSGSVTMSGTISYTGYNTATVSQTTTFAINRGYNTASGTVGGRSFSY